MMAESNMSDTVILYTKKLIEMVYSERLDREKFILHAYAKIEYMKKALESEDNPEVRAEMQKLIAVYNYYKQLQTSPFFIQEQLIGDGQKI